MSDLFEDAKKQLDALLLKVHEANPDLWIRTEEPDRLEYMHEHTNQRVSLHYRVHDNAVSIGGRIWRSSERHLQVDYDARTIIVRDDTSNHTVNLAEVENIFNFSFRIVTVPQTSLYRVDLILQAIYRAILVEAW